MGGGESWWSSALRTAEVERYRRAEEDGAATARDRMRGAEARETAKRNDMVLKGEVYEDVLGWRDGP